MVIEKDTIINTLRGYKNRRDDLLHEDLETFYPHLKRFIDYCDNDILIQSILDPLKENYSINLSEWWKRLSSDDRDNGDLFLPSDSDEEFIFRYLLMKNINENELSIHNFGRAFQKFKLAEGQELFRSLIIRSFAEELSHRIGETIDLASTEDRELQAVPLKLIPSSKEVRIFLSHKSVDKPLVKRYYQVLVELGYSPWLDESDLVAGTNLERELLRGFEESCAAIYFITQNYKDEKYLATEVDYAIQQKRKKGNKFAIITLRYPDAADVPPLLQTYTYKTITNDLDGIFEIIRALPIQAGPVRWKPGIIE